MFFIRFFFIFVCLGSSVWAQVPRYRNVDALDNINISLDRIENAITTLTSQNERTAYNQKQAQTASDIMVKDFRLQIQELRTEYEKLAKENLAQKIELENLKNIVSMMKEKVDSISKKLEAAEARALAKKQAEEAKSSLFIVISFFWFVICLLWITV